MDCPSANDYNSNIRGMISKISLLICSPVIDASSFANLLENVQLTLPRSGSRIIDPLFLNFNRIFTQLIGVWVEIGQFGFCRPL